MPNPPKKFFQWLSIFSFFRPCEIALKKLETIDDDAEKFSVDFVKVYDKRLAKQYDITEVPKLTIFRDGEMTPFDGDLTDAEAVLSYLTSDDTLTLPDKIEEVNAELLMKIIKDDKFVTALFFDESKDSSDILTELENIDDEADIFDIRFVRINDVELAADFSLTSIPSLVYFRYGIPIVYQVIMGLFLRENASLCNSAIYRDFSILPLKMAYL